MEDISSSFILLRKVLSLTCCDAAMVVMSTPASSCFFTTDQFIFFFGCPAFSLPCKAVDRCHDVRRSMTFCVRLSALCTPSVSKTLFTREAKCSFFMNIPTTYNFIFEV